jgi:hypothetical protein
MIRARLYLALTAGLLLILGGLLARDAARGRNFRQDQGPALARLGGVLGLTDLAIWTEARYSRHPAMADRFAAFQDAPALFDHFPAGSIVAPPVPPGGRP